MADHTLWGTSPPPWTANKASDGDPSIRTGSAIYSTATTLWVKGARIYVPAGHGLAGTATLALRVYDYETAPDFSSAPLRTVTVTISAGAGWYEARWASAVQLAPTDVAWISAEDLGVNYVWSSVPDPLVPRQAADGFDLWLSENDVNWRGAFQSPAQTGTTTASAFYFNLDGIFDTVPDSVALAAWAFDEGSGVQAADTIGTRHITMSSTGWTTGHTGSSLLGQSDTVTIPTIAGLQTANRTVMFWARAASGGAHWIFEYYIAAQDTAAFGIGWINGNLLYRVRTGGVNTNYSTAIVDGDGWHHFALTYDGAQMVAYRDGVVLSTQAVTGTIDTASSVVLVDGGTHVTDDLRVYDTALTAAGITALMNTPVSPPSGDVMVSVPLVTGTGQGHAPTVSVGVTVSAPLATAVGTASAPTISADVAVVAPLMTGVAQALAPFVGVGVMVSPPLATATGLASTPTVSVVAFIVVAVPLLTGQGVLRVPNAFTGDAAFNLPEVLTLTVVPVPKVRVVPYDRTLTVVEN